ncbi:unnamed protein product [Peronospora belbahrii]|uniref:Uncharacterized protein n=1 Tax=Peronospora belbahrii TaxID=622444 RepID=A0ABN8D3D3_9STRA|nr:unnamed protein product [Peronospora belbahrii]
MTTIANTRNTLGAPYAIQVNNTLNPERIVPCTPEIDDPSNYKQIDDDNVFGISTGHWSTNLFAISDNLVPNAFMASLCPCVSLAQITSRLGLLPFSTALLSFGILCSLELFVLVLAVVQYVLVEMLGRNGGGHHYHDEHYHGAHDHDHDSHYHGRHHHHHGHRGAGGRPAINTVLVVVAVLIHATFITALWLLRKRIRNQFEIPGSNMVDCVLVACCPCLSTAQMATHIKSYQPGSCSFGPVDTLPRYQ